MMLEDPERFLREKLSKKFLSANGVRDAMIASLLISLQALEEMEKTPLREPCIWREEKAKEIRKKANHAFTAIEAPSEYPTPGQLWKVKEAIEQEYGWSQWPVEVQEKHILVCKQLFLKFEDPSSFV